LRSTGIFPPAGGVIKGSRATFQSGSFALRDRDQWIGWDEASRRGNRARLVANARFLTLPWVRVPHLALHLLGQLARRRRWTGWRAMACGPCCWRPSSIPTTTVPATRPPVGYASATAQGRRRQGPGGAAPGGMTPAGNCAWDPRRCLPSACPLGRGRVRRHPGMGCPPQISPISSARGLLGLTPVPQPHPPLRGSCQDGGPLNRCRAPHRRGRGGPQRRGRHPNHAGNAISSRSPDSGGRGSAGEQEASGPTDFPVIPGIDQHRTAIDLGETAPEKLPLLPG